MLYKIGDGCHSSVIKKLVFLVLSPALLLNGQTPGSSPVGIAIKAPLDESTVTGMVTISTTAFASAGVAE